MIQNFRLTAHSLISSSHCVKDVSTAKNSSHKAVDITTFKLALIQVTINVWNIAGANLPPKVSSFLFGGVLLSTKDVI